MKSLTRSGAMVVGDGQSYLVGERHEPGPSGDGLWFIDSRKEAFATLSAARAAFPHETRNFEVCLVTLPDLDDFERVIPPSRYERLLAGEHREAFPEDWTEPVDPGQR